MTHHDDDLAPREVREYRVTFRDGRSAILDIDCPATWSDDYSRMIVRRRIPDRRVRSVARVVREVVYE